MMNKNEIRVFQYFMMLLMLFGLKWVDIHGKSIFLIKRSGLVSKYYNLGGLVLSFVTRMMRHDVSLKSAVSHKRKNKHIGMFFFR